MLKIIRNKNVKYIHTENIKYVIENAEGYLVCISTGKEQVKKDEFDLEKSKLKKCGDTHYNTDYVCDVEVVKDRTAFVVSTNNETGKRFIATGDLKNLIDGFYEVNRNDGTSVYINPDNVHVVEKPYITVTAKIMNNGVITEVPIEAGDQVTSCTVTAVGGKKFKFDAQEAVQLLSYYKEEAVPAKKKTPPPA